MNKKKFRKRSVTIEDLAAESGVSKITVYRVLNQPEKVRAVTRERVYQAMRELDKSSMCEANDPRMEPCIGVVAGSITEPSFVACVSAIQAHASEKNVDVYLNISSFTTEKEISFVKKMQSYNALCIILIGVSENFVQSLKEQVPNLNIPLLVLCDVPIAKSVDYVSANIEESIKSSMRYLIDVGHKRIGLILGWRLRANRAALRLKEYKNCLEKAGLPVDNNFVRIIGETFAHANMDASAGKAAMQSLLSMPDNRPTAVLVPTGILALGAIEAIKENSLSVPSDISVICLGDDSICHFMSPTISAVDNQIEAVLLTVDQYLNGIYAGTYTPGSCKQQLLPKLNLRESSGPPPMLTR